MNDLNDTVIRGYELKNLLGEGGFGAVYRAYQPAVKREVALKVILPEYANHPDFVRSFESEAQIIARLEHLHIVPLYDFWRDPDGAYIVMRLLRGGSLSGLIKEGPLSLEKASRMLDQIASALHTAHRMGIVHRDIKPDNVLIDEEHNAFLTDFGIAKDLEAEEEDEFDDQLTGSPHYISPEQAQQEQITGRSDIYSLGIVLFEMLTGEAPFAGNTTMMELILKQINDPLPAIQTLNPDIPDEIDLIIQRATAKEPESRYATALEFAKAFKAAIPGMAAPATIDEVEAEDEAQQDLIELITPSVDNPYKGLRPFEEADADDFFGRDELIRRLLDHVRENVFLAVIGPSGSGKSSVVKAGLIPRLRQGSIAGSKRWFYSEMVPGQDPFTELESALLSIATDRIPNLAHEIRSSEEGLSRAIERILPDDNSKLVLMIDQFEEVFTQVADEEVRTAFLNNLLVATTNTDSRLRIIVTMRADFYDRPLLYPGFGELIRKYSEVVLPLNADEMKESIIGPAKRVELDVEPALMSAIIAEIQEQPGALPLLQYALTEVFERRKGMTLTYEAYQASGGVLGALARRAEEIYVQLPANQQDITRQMFLRLVTLGEGSEDTRRRILQGDLLAIDDDTEATQTVLSIYSRYRLLTFDNDPVTRDPTLEVAHEALIREWTRLREWLNDSRDDVRTQQRLATAAKVWTTENRDASYLASGARLTQFESLLQSGNISLTQAEHDYTEASIAERERLAKAEAERLEHERRLEATAKRRLQIGIVMAISFTVIAVLLTIFALLQRGNAISAKDEAEENEQIAIEARGIAVENEQIAIQARDEAEVARQDAETARIAAEIENARSLSIFSQQYLAEDPIASVNLALRAFPDLGELDTLYVPEAEFALTQAIAQSQETFFINPTNAGIFDVAINDMSFATVGSNHLMVGTAALDQFEILTDTLDATTVAGVDFATDGRLLSFDGTTLNVWAGSQQVANYEWDNTGRFLTCAAWSPTDARIALCESSTTESDRVVVWNPDTNQRIQLSALSENSNLRGVRWLNNGEQLLAYDSSHILLWDSGTESNLLRIGPETDAENVDVTHQHTDPILGVIALNNGLFISYSTDNTIFLWDTEGNIVSDGLNPTNEPFKLISLSPDGLGLLITTEDRTADRQAFLWDVSTATPGLISELNIETVSSIDAIVWQDNTTIAVADANGVITVWDMDNDILLGTFLGHTSSVRDMFWQDAQHLVSIGQNGDIHQWQVFNADGTPTETGYLYESSAFDRGQIDSVRWLNDTTILATGNDGYARRYHTDTGEEEVFEDRDHGRWFVLWGNDGERILWYDIRSQRLELWNFDTQEMIFGMDADVQAQGVYWLENGIYYTDADNVIHWLDETGTEQATFIGHSSTLNDLRYSPVSNQLASAGSDTIINIYDFPAEATTTPIEPRVSLDTDGRIPVRLTWYEDGEQLASIGFNGDVALWDTIAGEQLSLGFTGQGDFPGRDRVIFNPTREFIVAPIDNDIIIFNFDGDIVFRRIEENAVLGVAWLPHETRTRLLTWGKDNDGGFVSILDIDLDTGNGTQVWRVDNLADVISADINNDATQVVIGGLDRKAIVLRMYPSITDLITFAEDCCQTRELSTAQKDDLNIKD